MTFHGITPSTEVHPCPDQQRTRPIEPAVLYCAGGPTCTATEFANAIASNGYNAQPDSKRTTMLASIQRVRERHASCLRCHPG